MPPKKRVSSKLTKAKARKIILSCVTEKQIRDHCQSCMTKHNKQNGGGLFDWVKDAAEWIGDKVDKVFGDGTSKKILKEAKNMAIEAGANLIKNKTGHKADGLVDTAAGWAKKLGSGRGLIGPVPGVRRLGGGLYPAGGALYPAARYSGYGGCHKC